MGDTNCRHALSVKKPHNVAPLDSKEERDLKGAPERGCHKGGTRSVRETNGRHTLNLTRSHPRAVAPCDSRVRCGVGATTNHRRGRVGRPPKEHRQADDFEGETTPVALDCPIYRKKKTDASPISPILRHAHTRGERTTNPHLGVLSFDSHSASSSFFLAARARISSRLTGTRASPPSRIANVWESSLTMCMCYTYEQEIRVKRD